ncbi:flagellar hook-associated protein FlgK [Pontibacillus marinus]|uniref:Flagellar hook-associated protein 1 n=1 Tax=Pontibacillus marinus BH030004 = DSM 16465 TaxID=1385511 RepID=A0A0A5G415_9BACI|nr:flagellar hook-associated protein FlgK [Pontibacillus marinus]KGX86794.1 hypothetical protein N783_11530 [Pontibacillus marinus BH030004 = DSM 16465]
MPSTFHGLEVAKRALFTQQSALYTTGHNISNANTEGYSRQRVNFEQTAPFPPASRNRPEIPGQVGSGVQAGSIERVREEFLDVQFRGENSKQGYYESLTNAINKMEEVMNEPSEQGLSKTMDRFWNSLQDLADNPQDSGARSVVRQRGMAVAETFNYLSNSLRTIQKDLKSEINVTVKDINSKLTQIQNLNKQIGEVEPHGYLPNDLYDERDRLIDELSGMMNIDVSYSKSSNSANAKSIAQGQANIQLADETGKPLQPPVSLLNGENVNKVNVTFNSSMGQNLVDQIQVGGQGYSFDQFKSQGKLKGLVNAMGYMGSEPQVEAFSVSKGFANADNITDSDVKADTTLTLKGTKKVDDGDPPYEAGEASTITITDGMSLQDLKEAINNETETTGVKAEIIPNGPDAPEVTPKKLVLMSEHSGKEANLSVSGSASETLGIQGETQGANQTGGLYTNMLQNLDKMASAFTEQFNAVHRQGYNLNNLEGKTTTNQTPNFFSLGEGSYKGIGAANTMQLSDAISQSTDNIAAAQEADSGGRAFIGNGENAKALADVKNTPLSDLGENTDVSTFYESLIGDMGVQSQEYRRLEDNSSTLRLSVEERRQSVSGVSLDEEMSNMIKFQHAYNAAARSMTTVDEMLDKIINGMGRVGR